MSAPQHTILAAAIFLGFLGCHSTPEPITGPYAPLSSEQRSTVLAEDLNQEAADLIQDHPAEAERLLREALTADLYFGPAHNNLGVIYLEQGKLYEAAGEFEWARKLMPGKPDPRMNLALTMEVAGRVDDALREYETALQVDPDHLPTVQALARLILSQGRKDPRILDFLEVIAMRSQPHWQNWARKELASR